MPLRSSEQPLDTMYDAALLDLDGVVYVGTAPVPAAPEAIDKARIAGMRVAFVTNNASRTPAAVAENLMRMGVTASVQDVVTSAQAAARLVAERFATGANVLAVGDTGLRQALRVHGLRPVSVAAEKPVAVVQGHSPRMGYDLIVEGALAVEEGALFVATNGDATAPLGRGVLPGNGSFARVIAHATGVEPIVAGKPQRPLHEEGVLRTAAERPLVVGDRLDTDIESATTRGVASMLVLSGVTTPAELVAAEPQHRPSYLAFDLSGLTARHPAVEVSGEGARCGGWVATTRGGHLELSGDGPRLDGLRALCAAAWSGPENVDTVTAQAAVAQLGW
ncbi:HAD-IIA family hydrolase [Salinactinospora qingdaonensis]